MSNIQIAAKAELFGAPIDAAFINEERKISADSTGKKEYTANVKTLVVYGKPEEPIRKDLTTVLSDLTFGLVKVETLKTKLPEAVANTLDSITVAINQVYFKSTTIDFTGTTLPTTDKAAKLKKENGEGDKEYALWIDINIDPKLMSGFPVKVTTLSLKIWSTDNKKVLQEMKITDIQKLLAGAGITTETTAALPVPEPTPAPESQG